MPYLDTATPLAFAHRGGALLKDNIGIENTIEAFSNAVELGFRYLETDVYASSDGVAHVFHDADTQRLLGKPGSIAKLSASQIVAARIDGRAGVPTLQQLLEAFPDCHFNIDLKHSAVIAPAIAAVRGAGAEQRCLFASFRHRTLVNARRLAPEIATAASPVEVAFLKAGQIDRIRGLCRRGGAVAVQVPAQHRKLEVVTSGLISAAHQYQLQVHVWTIDEPDEMRSMLDLGVDGIMSDRIDLLKQVLQERGEWSQS